MPLPVQPRRHFLLGSVSVVAACAESGARAPVESPTAPTAPTATPPPERSLADLEAAAGVRLGVFAVDTANDRQLAYRADERFAMCSTFKWVLAASVLAHVD